MLGDMIKETLYRIRTLFFDLYLWREVTLRPPPPHTHTHTHTTVLLGLETADPVTVVIFVSRQPSSERMSSESVRLDGECSPTLPLEYTVVKEAQHVQNCKHLPAVLYGFILGVSFQTKNTTIDAWEQGTEGGGGCGPKGEGGIDTTERTT